MRVSTDYSRTATEATCDFGTPIGLHLSDIGQCISEANNILRDCLITVRGNQPEEGSEKPMPAEQSLMGKLREMRVLTAELNQKAIEIRNHLS